jgi:tetratricopeptide (TPR) repeat protein
MTLFPLANILWLRGFPDQAIDYTRLALEGARMMNNALVLSEVLTKAGQIPLYIGDLSEAERSIETLLDCSAKHALTTHNALGRCLKGTLFLAQGDFTGLAVLRGALGRLREAGFALHYTAFLGTLAQGLGAAGQVPEAHMAIDEALERSDRNEELWNVPELLRVKGEILRLDGSADADRAAEGYFLQALDYSRRQEALSWELRAATSLAKLWHQGGKAAEAHDQLAAVYNRFTEGFDTVDLRTARALIEELRNTPGPA